MATNADKKTIAEFIDQNPDQARSIIYAIIAKDQAKKRKKLIASVVRDMKKAEG